MKIVVVGGGSGGLITAMLLAKDGHGVTVLERDTEGPPLDNEAAWRDWNRSGVTQLRQPHTFLGKACYTLMTELPAVWDAIVRSNPYPIDLKGFSPAAGTPETEGDQLLQVMSMRRSTFERLVAVAADSTANLEVRRGVVARGLVARKGESGPPVVTGVTTETGEDVVGDLVVDAAGRRSPFPKWLRSLGSDVDEWSESDGFTYHTMWFRSRNSGFPEMSSGLFGGMAPGLLTAVFPGDAGVFGIVMVGLGSDKLLRSLLDPQAFGRVARRLDPIADWVDPDAADAITEVMPMTNRNRSLTLANHGQVSAIGVVNVADSFMSSNPTLGRGVSLACSFSLELRDLLRETEDPAQISARYLEIQERWFKPFLTDAVESDAAFRGFFAKSLGQPFDDSPPKARTILSQAANVDADCWRRWSRVNQVFDTPAACTEDEELVERARESLVDLPTPEPDLSRDELAGILSP